MSDTEKVWQVWAEGYAATGERGDAQLMGTVGAPTFEEACRKLLGNDSYYNAEKNTYWGCRLFDNEKDARKSFG